MRNWLKTLLFISTFSPALISMAAARYGDKGYSPDVVYYAIAGLVGASLTLVVVRMIKRYGETIAFTAKKIESNDALMLGVIVTYVVPLAGKAADITYGVVLLIIGVLAVVFWISASILPHPLLRIMNYRFYKVESVSGVVFTLICERELLDPTQIKAVKRISGSMLVEVT